MASTVLIDTVRQLSDYSNQPLRLSLSLLVSPEQKIPVISSD